jgi:hypothetical protein
MGKDSTRQCVLFKGVSKKSLVARFDQEQASSDGGAVLQKACDERLGLSAAVAACLRDDRQQSKVAHSYHDIFQQRMFGIACGNADGNDAAVLPMIRYSSYSPDVTRFQDLHWPHSRRYRDLKTL